MTLSRQEMFDLAFIGLRNQGWEHSLSDGRCAYLSPDGRRCAWGHVEPRLTTEYGSASCIASDNVLSSQDYEFADFMQFAHDYSAGGWGLDAKFFKYNDLENNMRKFAAYYNLTIPECPEPTTENQ